jgi:hypothetical protein
MRATILWMLASIALSLGCFGPSDPVSSAAAPSEAPPEAVPREVASPLDISPVEESTPASPAPTVAAPTAVTMPVVGRSGWAYEDHEVDIAAASSGGTALEGDLCGLSVVLQHAPATSRCDDASFDARIRCMLGEYTPSVWLDDDDTEGHARLREQEGARLLLRDGRREVAIPAYPIANIGCLSGVAVVTPAAIEFSSRRSFLAVETREGIIVRAREVSIRDPHENESDCGNAWDGVELLPIVDPSGVVGSLVMGAVTSPRFELGVGEVGLSGVVEGDDPLVGYLLRDGILAGVPAGYGRAAECPIVVSDPDGETNVRPLPNTGRAAVGTLANGTQIDPVEQRGRWYRIAAPLAGWVFASSLARRCEDERADSFE